MSDQTSVTVTRTIDASNTAIFDVLSNPAHHVGLDGSGFVKSLAQGDRISETGQVFTMNMEGDHMGGEYQTDNHVVGYDAGSLLAWKTAPAGAQPPGWEWVWKLTPQGPDSTEVSCTYDWAQVTDKDLLKKITFPLVSEQQMEDTLARLAAQVSS